MRTLRHQTPSSTSNVTANAPRVDVKQREPVPARKGRTRVDVPAIADPLHLVHHEVPVHQCPKPRDRPAAVAANLLLRRIGAKQRNVDMIRRPRLEHRRRDGPVRMRNIRMHEADRTVGGLNRHRDRHACKRGTPAPVLGTGEYAGTTRADAETTDAGADRTGTGAGRS